MSARAEMTFRASVHREVPTGDTTRFNEPETSRSLVTDALPCFIRDIKSSVLIDNKFVPISELRLFMPKSADVKAEDEVSGVRDRLGEVVWPGPYRIVGNPLRRVFHKEALLGEY